MSDDDSDMDNVLVVDDGTVEDDDDDEDEQPAKSTRSEVDDSICPVCRGTTYVGETISCETCTYWFHFECVGVTHSDACVQREDVPFFCEKCAGGAAKKKANKRPPASARKRPPKAKKAKKAAATPAISPPIKLKISFNSRRNKARVSTEEPETPQPPAKRPLFPASSPDDGTPSKQRRKRSADDDEEKWLDAVEAGNLHAVDAELKSIRDPKLMTARQRAMVGRKSSAPGDDSSPSPGHMSLSYTSAKKASKPFNIEDEKQRALKTAKRKEIEQEKREQDKRKTMDRILNSKTKAAASKQALTAALSSSGQSSARPVTAAAATNVAVVSYVANAGEHLIHFPPGTSPAAYMGRSGQPVSRPPPAVKCHVASCENAKKYSCSKTGRPLCSLECYKRNLQLSARA